MNDARALLDSLMGQTRNQAQTRDQKKGDRGKQGEGFKDDSVCKLWLAGFCPEHEELFYNTKRDMGPCPKAHYEMHKEEFNVHPDRDRWMALYEEQLLRHLERLDRETRDIVARERIKYETYLKERRLKLGAASSEDKDPRGDNMKDLASKWLSEAEELAERGDLAGSKRKIADAKAAEEKAKEWEENQGPPDVDERICGICGERKDTEKKSAFKHEAGRVHQGVLLIKRKLAEFKKKEEEGKLKVDRDLLKEEDVRKERAARDEKEKRREKEREDRERKKRQREKEERQEREREARGKELREEEAKREAEKEEVRKKEEAAREAEKEEKRREREAAKEPKASSKRSRSKSKGKRENGEAKRRDRRSKSRSRRRRGDKDRDEDSEVSRRKKDDGTEESKQNIFKARHIEKQFMDLLLHAGLSAMDSYEDVQARLGKKDQWMDCPEQSRRELLGAWLSALKNM